MITLHYTVDGVERSMAVVEDDSSYRYRALMQKPQMSLKFYLPEYIEFPTGTWCDFQGQRFTLRTAAGIKKNGERSMEYSMTLCDAVDAMSDYKLRNTVDRRLKWSMSATPREFVEEIVKNMNERDGDGVWTVGECVESTVKTVEFNHISVYDALQSVADTFETEWEIVGTVVSLRKVEYFKDDPLPLSYGRGNGFVPGVGRTMPDDGKPVKRLYVQGGERNIDRSKYGSSELLLPKGQTLEYGGRTYRADNDGYYVERTDKEVDAVMEDSLDLSEIYPSREGGVSAVETIDAGKSFYDFIDDTIPDSLDFNECLIEGETPYIRFQTGMLAGEKDFEFKYKHAERRFELVPQEIDGVTMPNETFKPAVGDKYAVFGIMLPQSYIRDDASQEGASWRMFKEAVEYLYEHEDQKFTFTGELQGLWAKRNWGRVGGRLKVGSYILFSDSQFAKEGAKIRITGIKDYLNAPYSPQIELASNVSGGGVASELKKPDRQDVVIDDTRKEILRFTKRRFRDARETLEMLEGAVDGYATGINPVTVQTMAMLVGDESLQFRFVESLTDLTPVADGIAYNEAAKQLTCPASVLQHMTLGINAISPSHAGSDYKVWAMQRFDSERLDDGAKKYYLYARVSEDTSKTGVFKLSETPIGMQSESGYYHLLVGILNSEVSGGRSFVSLYGFTEILPGRITTDRIVSTDGESYFDLASNQFRLGGKGNAGIAWNAGGDETLTVTNATIRETLLVDDKAVIAGLVFTNSLITSVSTTASTLSGSPGLPNLEIDGSSGVITLRSDSTWDMIGGDSASSVISLDASQGGITAVSDKEGLGRFSSGLSGNGVYSNSPYMLCWSATSGYRHYAAIVGNAMSRKLNAYPQGSGNSLVAGVYGAADNEGGDAPSYGGYFWGLMANGLYLKTRTVNASTQLDESDTQVVVNTGRIELTLPNKKLYDGRTLFVWSSVGSDEETYTRPSIKDADGRTIYQDGGVKSTIYLAAGQSVKLTYIEASDAWIAG